VFLYFPEGSTFFPPLLSNLLRGSLGSSHVYSFSCRCLLFHSPSQGCCRIMFSTPGRFSLSFHSAFSLVCTTNLTSAGPPRTAASFNFLDWIAVSPFTLPHTSLFFVQIEFTAAFEPPPFRRLGLFTFLLIVASFFCLIIQLEVGLSWVPFESTLCYI